MADDKTSGSSESGKKDDEKVHSEEEEKRLRKSVKESLKEYFPTFSAAPGKVNAALKTDVSPYMKSFYERLLKKEEFGGEEKKSIFVSLLALALFVLVFSLDFSGRFSWSFYIRFLIYLVLSAILFLVLLAKSKMDDRKKASYVLILFIYSLLLPTFFGFIQQYFGFVGLTSIAIILLLPLGPVIFLEKVDFMHPKIKSFIVFFYALVMILLLVPYISNITNLTAVDHLFNTLSQYAPQVSPKDGLESWLGAVDKMKENAKKSWMRQINYATGGYYNGVVEENEKEPLGVYLEGIKPTEKQFFMNEPVSVWGTLKAKNLDTDNPIIINLFCSGKHGKNEVFGSINPDEIPDEYSGESSPEFEKNDQDLEVYYLDEKDIQCDFKEGQLDKGSSQVAVNAVFNFQTLSYLKTYFMNLETLRTLNRENIDPFSQYGITEKNPQAVFTNGPVKIGMELRNPPIGISPDSDTKVRLGITVENRWEGEIRQLRRLVVYLPEGMEPDETCDIFEEDTDPKPEDLGLRNELDRRTYKAYKLKEIESNPSYRDIKEFVSVVCFLKIPSDGIETLLAESPFSTRYIRATAEYDYNLKKEVAVRIEPPKGFFMQISPAKATSADSLNCEVSNSDFKIKVNKFEFKVDDQDAITPAKTCDSDGKKCSITLQPQKKGSKVTCTVNAERYTDIVEDVIESGLDTNAFDTYKDSVEMIVGNSLPVFRGLAFEKVDAAWFCKAKVEDKDEDDSVSLNYRFEGDINSNGKEVSCSKSGELWECMAPLPSEDIDGKRTTCKARAFDGYSFGKEASVSHSFPLTGGST
ncbi:hypothetical protein HY638_04670 [Candidatus Woesearchaeota archaeon]|nr:hypothetical protein [Candidatus Woesearchaeota archaeon]